MGVVMVAFRPGQEILIPGEYRHQFAKRGFSFREAPANAPEVTSPIGLSVALEQVGAELERGQEFDVELGVRRRRYYIDVGEPDLMLDPPVGRALRGLLEILHLARKGRGRPRKRA